MIFSNFKILMCSSAVQKLATKKISLLTSSQHTLHAKQKHAFFTKNCFYVRSGATSTHSVCVQSGTHSAAQSLHTLTTLIHLHRSCAFYWLIFIHFYQICVYWVIKWRHSSRQHPKNFCSVPEHPSVFKFLKFYQEHDKITPKRCAIYK